MQSKNKKNILLINSFIGGGAERQFSILANAGLFDSIICLEKGNDYINESEINIQYLSKHSLKTSSIFKYLYTPIYAYKIYKIIKKYENPTVTAVLERSHITVWLLSFIKKINYILSFQLSHKIHYNNTTGSILKYFFQKVINRSRFCVPNSIEGGKEIIELYNTNPLKVKTILNGYDFKEISDRASDSENFIYTDLLNNQFILCVARFYEQKAQDKLIRAFVNVKKTNNNLKLIFAGTGPLMENCINLSKSLGFKTFSVGDTFSNMFDVYFLGFQKNPLLLMKHSTLFAFPTYYEGLPNALIEAMICGSVPISSDCPTGPKEILSNENQEVIFTNGFMETNIGILVAPFKHTDDDIINWENSLLYILNNPSLISQMKESLKSQLNKYDLKIIKSIWIDLLNSSTINKSI